MELTLAREDGASTVSEGVVDFASGDSEMRSGPLGSERGDDAIVARTVGGEVFVASGNGGEEETLWVRLSTPSGADVGRPTLDPVSIADWLARSSGELTEAGTGEVRGEPTTVYRLDLPSGNDLLPLLAVPAAASVTATMEVDSHGRLRRLVAEPDNPGRPAVDDSGSPEFPVPERSELMLWDFGIEVEVGAPPTHAMVDVDDPRAGDVFAAAFDWPASDGDLPSDEPEMQMPQPSGPFALIAQGQWQDVTWEVWQAPGPEGFVCHSVNLEPPPYGYVPSRASGQAGVPESSDSPGAWTGCGPPADLFERGDPVEVFTGWSAAAEYWSMIGTAAPEISSLRVELDDGEATEVHVDPTTHVFALFSRGPLSIDRVVADAGDSASIECEPQENDGYGISYLSCSGVVGRR
jgi:hypothetical protein